MERRIRILLGTLGGVALGFIISTAAISAGARLSLKVTVVTVTIGKPTELALTISKPSPLLPGEVTFKVTNAGKIPHAFKICTSPTTSARQNACVGKSTKQLAAGQSAELTVSLTKPGTYEYLEPASGPSATVTKGVLAVVAVTQTPATSPSAATTPTTGSTPAGAPGTTTTSTTGGTTTNGCPPGETTCE